MSESLPYTTLTNRTGTIGEIARRMQHEIDSLKVQNQQYQRKIIELCDIVKTQTAAIVDRRNEDVTYTLIDLMNVYLRETSQPVIRKPRELVQEIHRVLYRGRRDDNKN